MCNNSELDASQVAELLDHWFPAEDIVLQSLRDGLHLVRLPPLRDVFRRGGVCRSVMANGGSIDKGVRIVARACAGTVAANSSCMRRRREPGRARAQDTIFFVFL